MGARLSLRTSDSLDLRSVETTPRRFTPHASLILADGPLLRGTPLSQDADTPTCSTEKETGGAEGAKAGTTSSKVESKRARKTFGILCAASPCGCIFLFRELITSESKSAVIMGLASIIKAAAASSRGTVAATLLCVDIP